MSPDSLYRWQVQVSVYCSWRIPAYPRCTQCSILLYLMDICFLQCICLWHILQIQTCVVVGPGFVSTSPAFMKRSASHPAGPHGRLAPQKTVNRAPISLHSSTQFHCIVHMSITCRVVRCAAGGNTLLGQLLFDFTRYK